MKRLIVYGGLILGAGSCNPFSFDTLADDAWVQIAERKDSETSGDFGADVIALPPAAEGGARFVVAVQKPAGMSQFTFGTDGSLKERVGDDATMGGQGFLSPLKYGTDPSNLARYGAEQFVYGGAVTGTVILYTAGFDVPGSPLLGDGPGSETGLAIASGNLGKGDASKEDIVVAARQTLIILPDADPAMKISCIAKTPNLAKSPVVNLQSVATGMISGKVRIVMSEWAQDGKTAWIRIFDPAEIQNGQECPKTGFSVPVDTMRGGPVAVAVGDLDGSGDPEFITGTMAADAMSNGETTAKVRVYRNVTAGSTPTGEEVPVSTTSGAADAEAVPSPDHGARIVIADVDGDSKPEVIVGDPGANIDDVSAAGRVLIYKMDASCSETNKRGPLCLVKVLFDPDPSRNDYFGRAIAVADFKNGATTTKILAIAQKAKLWVYFRFLPTMKDPRG